MEQLTGAAQQLHQAVASLRDNIIHLQQKLSGGPLCQAAATVSRTDKGRMHSPKHVVHFAPPFAAIGGSLWGGGANKQPSGDSSGRGPGKDTSSPQQAGGSSSSKGSSPGSLPGSKEQERIPISEVEVVGVDEPLRRIAQEAMSIRPNFSYSLGDVEADVKRVFSTGWFQSCAPDAEDTRDGVKLILKVVPNPELRGVVAHGGGLLPVALVQKAFRGMAGKTLNFVQFSRAVQRLDQWYRDKGVLGQVVDFTFDNGVVDLYIGEAQVSSIRLQFKDAKTGDPKEVGATRPDVITRHLTTKEGQVYSLRAAKADIDSIYSTGLFEDVNILPKEAADSTELNPKVDLTVNLLERKTGGLGAGTGVSAQAHGEGAMPGFVGSFTYSQRNFLGLNQRLSALAEIGQADSLVRLQWQDPWVLGDSKRTSRTVYLMNNRTSAAAIHGPAEPDGDAAGPRTTPSSPSSPAASPTPSSAAVILGRLASSVEWRQPLAADWSGSASFGWQRTSCLGEAGQPLTRDCYGCPLTFSGGHQDVVALATLGAAYSSPVDGSQISASLEQSLPLHRDWLSFSRMRLRLDQPVGLGPLTLALRGKAGAVFGDLPSYEAFPIGGTNSVRGYPEGGVGSGRYFVEGSAELRFKLISPVFGTLFADYATDLDSGETVIGDPAGARGKPGSGYGYGAGVRVDSPLGPIRLEYGWNQQRRGRLHVALGYD